MTPRYRELIGYKKDIEYAWDAAVSMVEELEDKVEELERENKELREELDNK